MADSDAPRPDSMERDEQTGSRPWWPWVLGTVAVVALISFAAVLIPSDDVGPDTTLDESSTATVQRQDLVVTETFAGTLGYGEAEAVVFQTSSGGVSTVYGGLAGIVTDAPDAGVVVVEGDVLYSVNTEPVVVLYGNVPVYRSLDRRTSDGSDVMALEQSLVDLGYDPDGDIEIDEDFTSATSDAIELLQEDIGAEVDGGFALGEMLFAVGPTYVADALVEAGDQVQFGQPVIALSAPLEGTFTEIAAEGDIIEHGDVLYRVDTRPTVLFNGDLPAYRTLALGDVGEDVAQLRNGLIDLGLASFDRDISTFDEATAVAVVEWQASTGAHTDGVVNLGEVVFLPESLRVGDVVASTGEAAMPGSPVVMTSASSTFVTVELATSDQSLVAVGDPVEVELPDDSVVGGTITSVGTVAQANQGGESYFEMIVTLDDPAAALGLDEAPVDVDVVSDSVADVLAVPVTALLALSEGGYAVEVVDGGSTHLVAVDTGLFADGMVEVDGNGLSDGDLVVVP